ncbi:MAG: hypothetical protein K1X56_04050 [Flavobacteriales bacterium]|nr:hypothetical protein [Flavobacteriales bacterium]
MRKSFKIAISALLTFVVFGIANLLGQPGKFIPPIYIDAIALTGIGIYFALQSQKDSERFALISLTSSLGISAWADMMQVGDNTFGFAFFSYVLLIIASVFHLFTFVKSYMKTPKEWGRQWMMFNLFLIATLIFLPGNFLGKTEVPLSAFSYWICGLTGVSIVWKYQRENEPGNGIYNFILLFSLSAVFDFLTYASLRWLF